MGGGDKIVLNTSKRLKAKYTVEYLCCPEGQSMALRELGKTQKTELINKVEVARYGLIFGYIVRCFSIGRLLKTRFFDHDIIWSASDFLPDTIPGAMSKIFFKKRWYANLFLRARNPFKREIQVNIRTVFYFLSQQVSIMLFNLFSDGVFVLAEADRIYLHNKGIKRVFILSGGVNLREVDLVRIKGKRKLYDACFVGRFHYQKGLPDLLSAWSTLSSRNHSLKLAIVGWGIDEEVDKIKELIRIKGLENNVILMGYLDGYEKYKVIKNSKLLLFPSNFESWGVVIAEALACGTPVLAYRLSDIVNNFPDGVVWVESGNIKKYTYRLNKLLVNTKEREILSRKALDTRFKYDWANSAKIFTDSVA